MKTEISGFRSKKNRRSAQGRAAVLIDSRAIPDGTSAELVVPLLISELHPSDLAGDGLGENVDELDLSGVLVGGGH